MVENKISGGGLCRNPREKIFQICPTGQGKWGCGTLFQYLTRGPFASWFLGASLQLWPSPSWLLKCHYLLLLSSRFRCLQPQLWGAGASCLYLLLITPLWMRSNYMSTWSTFRRAYAPPHHRRCQTGLHSLQEVSESDSELACVSLTQHTLENYVDWHRLASVGGWW